MVSKEAFERYENVRKAGSMNMLDRKVQTLANITAEEQQYIVRNYAELNAKFSAVEPEVVAEPETEAEPMGEVTYEDIEEMFAEDSVDARAETEQQEESE
tara:strand:- start:236 stop:535 length:300 start_codon:yes stop_codon:yes gene_type:complete